MKRVESDLGQRQRREAIERQDASKGEEKRHLDEKLDEALKETFPASDPIAVTPRRPMS